jgi:hypothetical protein
VELKMLVPIDKNSTNNKEEQVREKKGKVIFEQLFQRLKFT